MYGQPENIMPPAMAVAGAEDKKNKQKKIFKLKTQKTKIFPYLLTK